MLFEVAENSIEKIRSHAASESSKDIVQSELTCQLLRMHSSAAAGVFVFGGEKHAQSEADLNPKHDDGYAAVAQLREKVARSGFSLENFASLLVPLSVSPDLPAEREKAVRKAESEIRNSCYDWVCHSCSAVSKSNDAVKAMVSGSLSQSSHRNSLPQIQSLQETKSRHEYAQTLSRPVTFVLLATTRSIDGTFSECGTGMLSHTVPPEVYEDIGLLSGIFKEESSEQSREGLQLDQIVHRILVAVLCQTGEISENYDSLIVYYFILALSVVDDRQNAKRSKAHTRDDKTKISEARQEGLGKGLRLARSSENEGGEHASNLRFATADEVSTELAALQYASRSGALLDVSLKNKSDSFLLKGSDRSSSKIESALSSRFRFDRLNAFSCVRSFLDRAFQVLKRLGGSSPYSDCFLSGGTHGLGRCGVIDEYAHISLVQIGMALRRVQAEAMEDTLQLFSPEGHCIIPGSFSEELLNMTDDLRDQTVFGNALNFAKHEHGVKLRKDVFKILRKRVTDMQRLTEGSDLNHGEESEENKVKAINTLQDIADKCENIMRKVVFLIHIVGGGPARGTEIATYKLKNTASAPRNIFVLQNRVSILTEYKKSRTRMGTAGCGKILRVLDRVTLQIVVLYMALTQPLHSAAVVLMRKLHRIKLSSSKHCSPDIRFPEFLRSAQIGMIDETLYWCWRTGGEGGEAGVRNAINGAFHDLGIDLTVASYRQWISGIATTNSLPLCGEDDYKDFFQRHEGIKEVETMHKQAGRSPRIGGFHYGRSPSKDFHGLTLTLATAMRLTSERWHNLLFGTLDELVTPPDPLNVTNNENNQASLLSTPIKAVELVSSGDQEERKKCTPGLHQFSSIDPKSQNRQAASEWNYSLLTNRLEYCLRYLQMFMRSSSAVFSSEEQQQAVLISSRREDDLLAVLGTGSG